MEKYIASVDLDDTLLRSDKSVSKNAKEFIKKFLSKGHRFIINTGRPHQGAAQFLKNLDIHEPMIVNNGTAIVYYDDNYEKIIDYISFEMDKELIKDLLKEVKSFLHTELISCINDDYSYNFSMCPFWVIHQGSGVQFHQGEIETILNHNPIKVELWIYSQFKDEFLNIISKDKYKNEFEILCWDNSSDIISFELSKKGVNKGYAIEFFAKKCGINQKNIISFGDQLNDIPMIKVANYGVAMINSVSEVKRNSKYVTTYDHNNDGVIEFLKELITK